MKVILIGLSVIGIGLLCYVGFVIISTLLHLVHTGIQIAKDYIGECGIPSYILLVCAFGCWFWQCFSLVPNAKALGRVIIHLDKSYLQGMTITYRSLIPAYLMIGFVIASDVVGIVHKHRHYVADEDEYEYYEDSDDVTFLADYAAQHSKDIFISEPIEEAFDDTFSEELQEKLRVMYKRKWESEDAVVNNQGFLIQ